MKKWALAIAVAFFALVAVAAGAVALTDESGGDSGERVSLDTGDLAAPEDDGSTADCATPPCDDVTDGGAAGICLEGTIDCVDTPVQGPLDHVCIGNYPEPAECLDPDAPVSSAPPVIDPPQPISCDSAVNTDFCEKTAISLAIEDLSLRLGSAQAITVKSSEYVQWPDSCIGISKTDIACAEVITPGYRIILVVGENTFEYHTEGASRAELVE